MTEKVGTATVVPEPSQKILNKRQEASYRETRRKMLEWMLYLGKNPKQADGYAEETVRVRAYRLDKFYRFVWNELEDGYTEEITTEHANKWLRSLAKSDESQQYKADCLKSLKTLFKWMNHDRGRDVDFEPCINYSTPTSTQKPRDVLTREEARKLREVSLEYKSIPSYHSLTPEERDEWKAHLAQRFGKKKVEISKKSWEKANSFKWPSLIWCSLDAGLRPVEIERSKVSWVDAENGMLRIPKEDSAKNRENWQVPLQEKTAEFLERWLSERSTYTKYEGRDELWLSKGGNPYQSYSLNYHFKILCDEAGIELENRDLTWYSIRHFTGTEMSSEEGLSAAAAQLRHKSPRTTRKYDHAPVENRRDALNRMID